MNPELNQYREKVAKEVAIQAGISAELASHTISKLPEWERGIERGFLDGKNAAKTASEIIFS